MKNLQDRIVRILRNKISPLRLDIQESLELDSWKLIEGYSLNKNMTRSWQLTDHGRRIKMTNKHLRIPQPDCSTSALDDYLQILIKFDCVKSNLVASIRLDLAFQNIFHKLRCFISPLPLSDVSNVIRS